MADTPELKVLQKIQVARRGETKWYASTIQDIHNDQILIALPRTGADTLILYPGEEVEVRFFDNASFFFNTRCLGKTTDTIPLYRLAQPENIRRIQQRRYVRLPVALEVFYALPPEKNRRPRFMKGIAVDISSGGMKLAVDKPVEIGTNLLLKFSLPLKSGIKEISVTAKVLRLWVVEVEDRIVYHVALEFTDISRMQEDYIMNFIFTRMIEKAYLR